MMYCLKIVPALYFHAFLVVSRYIWLIKLKWEMHIWLSRTFHIYFKIFFTSDGLLNLCRCLQQHPEWELKNFTKIFLYAVV